MEIEITGALSSMQGVGRAPDGRAVFVPGALPGERVEAEIAREQPRYIEARLQRVLRPHEMRRTSDCPYAGACGGCQARHMAYELSLELKRVRVVDALERVGGVREPEVEHVLGMERPERMRNKAEYLIRAGRIGCAREDGRSVVEAEDCLLQHESSVRAMRVTRSWLKASAQRLDGYLVTRTTCAGDMLCVLSTDRRPEGVKELERALSQVMGMKGLYLCSLKPRAAHALDGPLTWVSGARSLTDELLGLQFKVSPESFFQVNAVQAEALYRTALKCAALTGRERVFDAYCGAGTITLCMAREAREALGVEIVGRAIEDARENARGNGLEERARFFVGDAARVLPELLRSGAPPDVLSVDPPRKGLDEALVNAVRKARLKKMVYVSCDPGTLARDVKRLTEGGVYRFVGAQPVDMFPWTQHIEVVCLLTGRGEE